MGPETLTLREAAPADAPAVRAVYAPYVAGTAVTFEYDVPSEEEMGRRIERTLRAYPYVLAETAGEIVGYAYLGAFVGREAYIRCAETSVYVAEDRRGRGIGRALCVALERIAAAQGIISLEACIAVPAGAEDKYLTLASARFHGRMGYRETGRFEKCGYKFGRWYSMVWMEKTIGVHAARPAAFVPYPELGREILEGAGLTLPEPERARRVPEHKN